MGKDDQASLLRELAENPRNVSSEFASLGMTEKELHKHAVIERLPFNLAQYVADGTVDNATETLLIVVYLPDGESSARYFAKPLAVVSSN